MKYTLIFFLSLAICMICHSQDLPGSIKKIKTAEQAWNFLDAHPRYKGEVISFKEIQDSSTFAKKLYQTKRGTILSYGQYIYKVLWDTISPFSKVSYIYFNGDSLTIQQIDSLRSNILNNINPELPSHNSLQCILWMIIRRANSIGFTRAMWCLSLMRPSTNMQRERYSR